MRRLFAPTAAQPRPGRAGTAWDLIPQLMEEAEKKGRRFPRKKPIVRPQNPIEWRANLTQIKNPDGSAVSGIDADQISYGEIEVPRQCWDTFEFIRSVTPGFEKAYIVEINTCSPRTSASRAAR